MNLNDSLKDSVDPQNHIGLPPGARVEFIVNGPAEGVTGLLVTRTVDTGPGGENDTNRMLAKIVASPNAPESGAKLESSPAAASSAKRGMAWECSSGACAPFVFFREVSESR